MRQRVHYLKTPDDVHIAWAAVGSGPVLVKPSNWLTHLEYDWESPVWRHWMEFLARHFRYVRYDERGCGMTDWATSDLSQERWPEDLECVMDAADIEEPAILLGISQGAATAITFAERYPERVSKLILYGGYARGWQRRGNTEEDRYYDAIVELMGRGWGQDNSSFRQVFTSRFIPEASEEQIGWFNELCRKTTTGDIAVRLMDARARVNVTDLLGQIQVPTLVLHARADELVPVTEGRNLAASIPGASFVELDSCNHILLKDEPAWQQFQQHVLDFVGLSSHASGSYNHLTPREKDILQLLTKGYSNARIADQLSVSEKTVRNQVSGLLKKLGVSSRSEAIVHAHNHDF